MVDKRTSDAINASFGTGQGLLSQRPGIRDTDSELGRDVTQALQALRPPHFVALTYTATGAVTGRVRIPWSRPGQPAPYRAPGVAMIVRILRDSNRGELNPTAPSESTGRALHDTTHSPIGLWQLQDDHLDTSGNGHDLTATGTSLWNDGWIGTSYRTASGVYGTRADTTFRLLGAVTVAGIVRLRTTGSLCQMASYSGVGATEATNIAWGCGVGTNGEPRFVHEYGAGNLVTVQSTTHRLAIRNWAHLAATRNAAGTHVKVFLNGEKCADSSGLTAPTGATSASLYVGSSVTTFSPWLGSLNSVAVFDTELAESDVQALYARCFLPTGASWPAHNFTLEELGDGGVDLLLPEPFGLTADTSYRMAVMLVPGIDDLGL